MNWHSLPEKEVFKLLKTDPDTGLSGSEAKRRREKYGRNELPRPKPLSELRILADQFKNPLILILVSASAVTVILKDASDTIILLTTVAVNTAFGYFQELKTSRIIEALKNIVKTRALVKRNGEEKEIAQENVVPGDVIILKAGLKVPADGRLFSVNNLRVNESALTGEWLPETKNTAVLPAKTPLAERSGLVHMGTIIESGEGAAIAVETGKNTEIGKIALATKEIKTEKTPYQKKLERFSRVIGGLVGAASLSIFSAGLLSGTDPKEIFLISVAVAVAAVPEGLPMAMTVVLAVGSQAILKKKGLIRRLASVETLGSASVILMDKTGTLTEARMKVAEIFAGNNLFADKGESPEGPLRPAAKSALKSAVMASEAFIENFRLPVEKWIIRGRPMEKSIVEAGIKAGLIRQEIETDEPALGGIVFGAEWRYSAVLHVTSAGSRVAYSMGAPEAILERSARLNDDEIKISDNDREALLKKTTALAAKGMHVIAVGRKKISDDKISDKDLFDMVFIGIIAFTDRIRPEVGKALESARRAGIRPIIVTGDNPETARTIANSLGFEAAPDEVVDGSKLETLSDEELTEKIERIKIFARVAPSQKLRIVSAWQRKNQVVAMIGDGVNDAPAIKKADIGVALGSGTDAAKEAADFVLLDDSFAIIETAIEEGRRVIDNIRKVITYILSDSLAEILIVGFSIAAGLPLPITAAQILWINLIEDGLPNIALAFEPKEKDIMLRQPARREEPLINKEMKVIIFAVGILTDIFLVGIFFALVKYGYELDFIRTAVFALLAVDSLLYVFSCKNLRKNIWRTNLFSNKFLAVSIAIGAATLLSAIYFSPVAVILGNVPLPLSFWPVIIGLGIINLALIEAVKYYFIKYKLTEA